MNVRDRFVGAERMRGTAGPAAWLCATAPSRRPAPRVHAACVRCTWIRSRAAVLRNRAVARSQAAGPPVLRIHAALMNRSRMSIPRQNHRFALQKSSPTSDFLLPPHRFLRSTAARPVVVADTAGGGESDGGGRLRHGMPPAAKYRRPRTYWRAAAKNEGEEVADTEDKRAEERAGCHGGPGGGAEGKFDVMKKLEV
uniref:Uncharacterized protein n=1 Tax=Oryza sativa subsp. japonica TaxID=39947 RepID=Q60E94_ORYSJ|nr:hypothetical protein [Oryza sativa Japonica Group]